MTALRRAPLYARLLLLVGVALLPVVLLAISGLVILGRQQHAQAQQALVERARAFASAVDIELLASVAALEILARSETLDSGEFKRFFAQAQSAVSTRPGWSGIILADLSGNRILSTRIPYGSPLPGGLSVIERESFEAILATRRPLIGNIAKGPGGRNRFPVRVPVLRGGQLRYILTAFVDPEVMRDILERQKVPAESVSTIFDARMNIVARSRNHEQYVGTPVSQTLSRLLADAAEGWGPMTTREGQVVYTAYSRSTRSGWGVALGAPKHTLDAPIRRSYAISGAGLLISLAVAVMTSVILARRITRPISQLRSAAQAVGRGEAPSAPRAAIPEVDEVASALAAAATGLRASEERLRQLNATLEARVEERTAALHRMNAELAATNRELDAFSYSVSHDLREPLRAIDGFSHIVLSDHAEALPSEGRRYLQLVRSNVRHMSELIDGLLAFARLARQPVARRRFELRPLVEECLDEVRRAHEGRAVEVIIGELPVCEADPTLLRQVLLNLIGNAFKYTGKEQRARVDIGCERRGAEDILYVRDNGVGFDMKYADKLFRVFERLHRNEEFEGTGVGLAIVQRIVDRHGGRVWAEAETGRGATFHFTLGGLEY